MLSLSVSLELVSPGEHLGTELALIWQDSGMERPLVDLNIGLGGECFVTEPTLEVPPTLVYHLYVGLELHPAGQQFSTNITGEQLFRNNLALGVNTVLPRPVIGR